MFLVTLLTLDIFLPIFFNFNFIELCVKQRKSRGPFIAVQFMAVERRGVDCGRCLRWVLVNHGQKHLTRSLEQERWMRPRSSSTLLRYRFGSRSRTPVGSAVGSFVTSFKCLPVQFFEALVARIWRDRSRLRVSPLNLGKVNTSRPSCECFQRMLQS